MWQDDPAIKDIRVGGYTLEYNGCEIIATYNILRRLSACTKIEDIIFYYEENGLCFMSPNGMFGVIPSSFVIDQYFKTKNCITVPTDDLKTADTFLNTCNAIMLSYWNEKDNIMEGAHTVALLKENNGWFAYNVEGGKKGITSIEDFINEKNENGKKKKFINARAVHKLIVKEEK